MKRLHLGCGRHYLDGWINIDIVANPKSRRPPDIIGSVTKLDFPDNSVDAIQAIHLFEHFNKGEALETLDEWVRVLKPGGVLILEMPDLLKCARNLLESQDDPKNHLFGIYGNHDEESHYMYHKYGWSFSMLKPHLKKAGMVDIIEADPQWHGQRKHRDFRVEARKA